MAIALRAPSGANNRQSPLRIAAVEDCSFTRQEDFESSAATGTRCEGPALGRGSHRCGDLTSNAEQRYVDASATLGWGRVELAGVRRGTLVAVAGRSGSGRRTRCAACIGALVALAVQSAATTSEAEFAPQYSDPGAPSCVYQRRCVVIQPFVALFAGRRNYEGHMDRVQLTRVRVAHLTPGEAVKFAPGCRGQPKGFHLVAGTSWEARPRHMICNPYYGLLLLEVQVKGPLGVLGRGKSYSFDTVTGESTVEQSWCEYEQYVTPRLSCPGACSNDAEDHERRCGPSLTPHYSFVGPPSRAAPPSRSVKLVDERARHPRPHRRCERRAQPTQCVPRRLPGSRAPGLV
jgi:hypothetical protein